MSWLTVRYSPGFSHDPTSWTTTIEREGKLHQQVDAWPSRTTVTHRAMLSEQDAANVARLVGAIDFAALADRRRHGAVVTDTSMIRVDVVERAWIAATRKRAARLGLGQVRRFVAPLLWWEWAKDSGKREYLPDLDVGPALDLWHTVDRLSPRHLGRAAPAVVDWSLNVQPAAAELRRLRSGGLDLESALDHMRGCWFTLPAVREAVIEVEGMDAERVSTLFEARKDLNGF